MEQIMQYLIEFSPAITAFIGIIVSLVVGIKKIKAHNNDTLDEIKSANAKIIELYQQEVEKRQDVQRENEEIKRDLRKMMTKLNHVHFTDKD